MIPVAANTYLPLAPPLSICWSPGAKQAMRPRPPGVASWRSGPTHGASRGAAPHADRMLTTKTPRRLRAAGTGHNRRARRGGRYMAGSNGRPSNSSTSSTLTVTDPGRVSTVSLAVHRCSSRSRRATRSPAGRLYSMTTRVFILLRPHSPGRNPGAEAGTTGRDGHDAGGAQEEVQDPRARGSNAAAMSRFEHSWHAAREPDWAT